MLDRLDWRTRNGIELRPKVLSPETLSQKRSQKIYSIRGVSILKVLSSKASCCEQKRLFVRRDQEIIWYYSSFKPNTPTQRHRLNVRDEMEPTPSISEQHTWVPAWAFADTLFQRPIGPFCSVVLFNRSSVAVRSITTVSTTSTPLVLGELAEPAVASDTSSVVADW